ncbi:MAG: hypothetical protein C5B59_01155 [Bacteroidetes bacterium]|nr:MAG: hypothetical protein C5B59_01155 [Bacteroidota bacterium]
MKDIRKTFSLNWLYLSGVGLLLLSGLIFLLVTSKGQGFLYINSFHTKPLDSFFIAYTNLGDGIFTILIVLFLLATRRFDYAWQILAAFLISGLIVQILKNTVYSPRPREFFANQHIYLLDGITLSGTSSFPSGHTATIFALATLLSFFTRNKWISLLYLLLAISVGYSRIYLSQHFPLDVWTGACIGVFTALAVYFIYYNRIKHRLSKKITDTKTATIQ